MGEEAAGERNKALQDAVIARRKKRINAHLRCINGVGASPLMLSAVYRRVRESSCTHVLY